jgi:3-(3-hydroxy-phenyl)propionate hydroxylase
VVQSSGELVRSTKYSETGTHAEDYVKLVERRAGNVTGMGIRYSGEGLCGTRLYDFALDDRHEGHGARAGTRLYSLLDYTRFTLFVFSEVDVEIELPAFVNKIWIRAENSPYSEQLLLVRPDAYIAAAMPVAEVAGLSAVLESIVGRHRELNHAL